MSIMASDAGAFKAATAMFASLGGEWHEVPLGGGGGGPTYGAQKTAIMALSPDAYWPIADDAPGATKLTEVIGDKHATNMNSSIVGEYPDVLGRPDPGPVLATTLFEPGAIAPLNIVFTQDPSFTVSWWMNHAHSDTGGIGFAFDDRIHTRQQWGGAWNVWFNADAVTFGVAYNDPGNNESDHGTKKLIHHAITYDAPSRTARFYRSGLLLKTVTNVDPPTGTAASVSIGKSFWGTGGDFGVGYFQHFAYWKRVLSEADLLSICTGVD